MLASSAVRLLAAITGDGGAWAATKWTYFCVLGQDLDLVEFEHHGQARRAGGTRRGRKGTNRAAGPHRRRTMAW